MKFSGKFASVAIFAAFGVAAMATADIGPFSSIGQSLRMSVPLTSTTTGAVTSKVTLELLVPSHNSNTPGSVVNGVRRTGRLQIDAKVTADLKQPGNVTFYRGTEEITTTDFPAAGTQTVLLDLKNFENRGVASVKAIVKYKDTRLGQHSSEEIQLDIDTEGPLLSSVKLIGDPTADVVGLRLRFKKDDLEERSQIGTGDFIIERRLSSKTYSRPIAYATADGGALPIEFDGATLTLPIVGPLVVGEYRVTVKDSLKDQAGNPAGQITVAKGIEPQQLTFSTGTYRPTGAAIDFPQYTQREKLDPDTNFNPGDHVETRVVRLYYNRDAHRVAQIINRDIKQWNRAGVHDARTFAKEAREEASAARARREQEEENATEVTKQLRTMERQLAVKKQAAERARTKLAQVKVLLQQLATLGPESGVVTVATPPSSIPSVTISNAKIIGANIQQGTVTGGRTNNGVTTDGALGSGTLTAGRFTAPGIIHWEVAGEPEFGGKVVYRYSGAIAGGSLAPTSRPTISGGTIKGETTGGVTSNAELTGSLVQGADIQGARLTMLKKETVNQNQVQINAIKSELRIQTDSDEPQTGDESTLATAVATAEKAVADLESRIAQQGLIISEAKKQVSNSQRQERIANRTEFEAEVASGTADPDSYAPADLASIDPVMQVSISVIGEGVIQLRGPIRGINEIRTMINQIDSPLGQVKVGLFTVQINGEEGDKMDEVAARLEGYIDLSRFLTNQSLQLLRRAVQETAGQISSQFGDQYPMHRQIDRDRKYVYAFFGRDFVDELYEMDSEFLHTENKLLSIHAMDTVSLPQATFLMALAKNSVREQILDRFMQLVQTELPVAEYSQRRTAGMLKRSRDINAFRRLISIPGFPKDPERALAKYRQQDMQKYCQKAAEIYRFHNLMNFFRADVYNDDVMTPVQREFIRLAQIFKSQMIAEIELKQRVVERALIQDAAGNEEQERRDASQQHGEARERQKKANWDYLENMIQIRSTLQNSLFPMLADISSKIRENHEDFDTFVGKQGVNELLELFERREVASNLPFSIEQFKVTPPKGDAYFIGVRRGNSRRIQSEVETEYHKLRNSPTDAVREYRLVPNVDGKLWAQGVELVVPPESAADFLGLLDRLIKKADKEIDGLKLYRLSTDNAEILEDEIRYLNRVKVYIKLPGAESHPDVVAKVLKIVAKVGDLSDTVVLTLKTLQEELENNDLVGSTSTMLDANAPYSSFYKLESSLRKLRSDIISRINEDTDTGKNLINKIDATFSRIDEQLKPARQSATFAEIARVNEVTSRVELDHKKLLDYLIDEKEEKFIELVEGTRSHIAQMDNYLKRLAIALEDDFKVQFYDPAFEGVRAEGRDESVNFGQIERTTILTNNRTFAKVSPQASMEFDLPKRAPVVVEAMSGAKALMQDYGALVNDPTFVGLTGALSGSPAVGGAGNGSAPQVKPLFPTQGTDSQSSFLSGGPPGTPGGRQKTSLEQLIPDPAVYKIQTGTGFEIRPVIQPDGHSIMYDFNYLYTTNVREPVDPDEKHLGRIKQHYIHTQVQTSSFELREISRYQVALKVSRTSRGVPLLEDIPVAGALFKPAPSAESSLQQNIILGQTTVYPTLFDLMGLRWSRHVADLDHMKLRELEHVVRGRNRSINDYVFDKASEKVDGFLGIDKNNDHYREDFYHRPSLPTPYHPNGYIYTKDGQEIKDPTGQNFYRRDPRPEEYRVPQFDDRRRGPSQHYHEGLETIDDIPSGSMEEISDLPAANAVYGDQVAPQEASTFPLFPQAVAPQSAIRQMSYERTAPVRN